MSFKKLATIDIPKLILIEELSYISPWSEETFQRCFAMGWHVWGLELADELVGYVIFTVQLDECHILNICVHPEHQKKGYGFQLMEYALNFAKQQDACIAFLEVRRSNESAISLYIKMGFIQIGERKNYYPTKEGREDAIIFAKDLL